MNRRQFALIVLLSLCSLRANAARSVSLDQVGYKPQSPKYAFVSSVADSFRVLDAATNSVRFVGQLILWRASDPATGNTVRRGDFTAFQQNGEFRVVTSAGDSSERFSISDTVYNQAYRKTLKGFYFQRCGISLAQQNAGVYQHPACHTQDGYLHSSTGSSGSIPATGGWHDAGDYGKYVVNAGVSVGTLLMAYEYFPSKFSQDHLNIPESGNGVPDLLDEVRYELEWLLKMQRSDGGVYHKLTREQFEGFVMPQTDNAARYLYEVSSTATADFAAMMARAARIYLSFDAAFAQLCRTAAVSAWSYLVAHPSIVPTGGFRNPSGTATGEYGDTNDSDERLCAAAELFVTTGEADYNSYYQSNYSAGGIFGYQMGWQDLRDLAHLTYLKSQQPATNESIRSQLRSALQSFCNTQVSIRNNSGYQVALQTGDYYWGSNSVALNAAVLLIMGYMEFNAQTFLDVAADQMHYIFGSNAHSLSFVTGVGKHYMRHPHHRPSESDGIAEPVPGLMAGGPDRYRDDAVLQALFSSSTPPALCYVDTMPSYASNEICINWNAPLVFVVGYFNGSGVTAVTESHAGVIPKEIRLDQNYPNPFNPSTTISFGLPFRSFVSLRVFDLTGREIASIVSEELSPGSYTLRWNAEQLASGVYFCRLTAGSFSETKKLVLLR
ncbi:MAG: glycoside hydrolase family 9 protein [Bacteroidota bacterium]